MATSEPLHRKYRPTRWEEVVGHYAVVSSLRSSLDELKSGAFLLCGPSGVGKTTIARLIAKHKGIHGTDLMEVDAGQYTGIDTIRELVNTANSSPLVSAGKCVIMDECHALSRQAWEGLLKAIEEPPEGVFWVLCTTNPAKVPKTIQTRCQIYELDPLSDDEIFSFLADQVVVGEELDVSDDVIALVSMASKGSLRQALIYFQSVIGIEDINHVKKLLKQYSEKDDVHDLCRMICTRKNMTWKNVVSLLRSLRDNNIEPEQIRVKILRYAASMVLNAKGDERRSMWPLYVMDQLSESFQSHEGYAPLIVALGRIVLDVGED